MHSLELLRNRSYRLLSRSEKLRLLLFLVCELAGQSIGQSARFLCSLHCMETFGVWLLAY